ncbi:MAG TPA: alpha/beta fold hydrolase [Sedimenticola thiotaurini]|uniref:Alpha/beta fold hydrolase n=1 Tax=Sedimenticola thiotaurini TaxID=1543721 RepID=A0A831RL24_9GAMM|nr:alpha/beta fold hydrolase [Sedimenticola thiotaurini]
MKALVIILIPVAGILAFYAYLYISDPTPYSFEVDRDLFPYEPHFLQLKNGGRLHYIDEGEGPTLLLLHGNPTWSFLYRDIVAELKDRFRLVAPDYPGYGLSSTGEEHDFKPLEHARAISELVRKLDLNDVVIMVQDWGGPIGFRVALDNPKRIRGFVIGNTWAWPLERPGQKGFSLLMGGLPGRFGAWCCNMVVRFFMSKGVANSLSSRELAMYLGPFARRESRAPTHLAPAQLRDAHRFLQEIHEKLPTLANRPVLLTWGLQDFAFRDPERTRFEELFPRHQTLVLENAAHFIQEDAPQEISAAITEWYGKYFPAPGNLH